MWSVTDAFNMQLLLQNFQKFLFLFYILEKFPFLLLTEKFAAAAAAVEHKRKWKVPFQFHFGHENEDNFFTLQQSS